LRHALTSKELETPAIALLSTATMGLRACLFEGYVKIEVCVRVGVWLPVLLARRESMAAADQRIKLMTEVITGGRLPLCLHRRVQTAVSGMVFVQVDVWLRGVCGLADSMAAADQRIKLMTEVITGASFCKFKADVILSFSLRGCVNIIIRIILQVICSSHSTYAIGCLNVWYCWLADQLGRNRLCASSA
jgi:hypothetical protein